MFCKLDVLQQSLTIQDIEKKKFISSCKLKDSYCFLLFNTILTVSIKWIKRMQDNVFGLMGTL